MFDILFYWFFYYFCIMEKNLTNLGNIPITTSILKSLYPEIVGGSQKIRSLERDDKIIRLRRGIYVCNPEITGATLSTELIANHLYTPSYVSMASALRYYGLIPEEVYTIQSMTSKNSKTYNTPLGRFEYLHICREAFGIGITSILKDNYLLSPLRKKHYAIWLQIHREWIWGISMRLANILRRISDWNIPTSAIWIRQYLNNTPLSVKKVDQYVHS